MRYCSSWSFLFATLTETWLNAVDASQKTAMNSCLQFLRFKKPWPNVVETSDINAMKWLSLISDLRMSSNFKQSHKHWNKCVLAEKVCCKEGLILQTCKYNCLSFQRFSLNSYWLWLTRCDFRNVSTKSRPDKTVDLGVSSLATSGSSKSWFVVCFLLGNWFDVTRNKYNLTTQADSVTMSALITLIQFTQYTRVIQNTDS